MLGGRMSGVLEIVAVMKCRNIDIRCNEKNMSRVRGGPAFVPHRYLGRDRVRSIAARMFVKALQGGSKITVARILFEPGHYSALVPTDTKMCFEDPPQCWDTECMFAQFKR